ncbi:MAG: acyl-CoA dehydrogenase family protein, partial [Thermodesulfobacteriota bacterium]|nr:acyl-CoA dehydrogenase family protein [Thermodesulfobacteriota bacterium]
MDFRFSPEEEKFRQEVRHFLETEVTDEMVAEVERGTEIGIGPLCWELMKKMGERRWLAPAFPREYGG